MILSSPPQFGQCSRSISNTRLSSRAQLMRAGRPCAQHDSVAVSSDLLAACSGAWGTTSALSLALGEHPVEADQVQPRSWHGRLKGALRSPVQPGAA